jgi:hypothetical protein
MNSSKMWATIYQLTWYHTLKDLFSTTIRTSFTAKTNLSAWLSNRAIPYSNIINWHPTFKNLLLWCICTRCLGSLWSFLSFFIFLPRLLWAWNPLVTK